MNSNIAIKVSNVSKKYSIGKQKENSLRNSIIKTFKSTKDSNEVFWALKNISFEILRGDVIGIIGKNGAGKSTLLKILSQITKPSEGKLEINGRIASLLEVGTGFHPDLTGRENIYLNGTILGMTRKEVKSKFEEIVAFSGVEKFIDTPVKNYSSGMYVRLAFAVAAHLDPEILIIDEVLAVGDAEFQRKCLGKMQEVAGEGRTVIFVSHNLTAVKTLCNKSIVIKDGGIVFKGSAKDGIDFYSKNDKDYLLEKEWEIDKPGKNGIQINKVSLNKKDKESTILYIQDSLKFKIDFNYIGPEILLNLSLVIKTTQDEIVFNQITDANQSISGNYIGEMDIPDHFLNNLTYQIDLYFVKDTSVVLFFIPEIITFEIFENQRDGNWFGDWVGLIRPSFINFNFTKKNS